jgi:hypothetical protein
VFGFSYEYKCGTRLFSKQGTFICRLIPDRETSFFFFPDRDEREMCALGGSRMRKPNSRPDTRPEERILGKVAEHRGIITERVVHVEYLAHLIVHLAVKEKTVSYSLERVKVLRLEDCIR